MTQAVTPELLAVTQEDRLAASRLQEWNGDDMPLAARMLGGLEDDHPQVQAFARHRLASASAPAGWRTMESAPKDGTMIRLLVDYADGGGALEDALLAWTIGFNGFEDHGVDEWKFAGWDWCHDAFCEGSGKPVGWLPWSNPSTDGDAS